MRETEITITDGDKNMTDKDMSDTDARVIDSFLRCTSIGRELDKHEKRYKDMLDMDAENKYTEQQRVIVSRLKGLRDEVCNDA